MSGIKLEDNSQFQNILKEDLEVTAVEKIKQIIGSVVNQKENEKNVVKKGRFKNYQTFLR